MCLVCALAVLLTAGITTTLLKRGKQPDETPAESVSTDTNAGDDLATHYQIDTGSSALLPETADAGEEYLDETLFIGDSNTVRLYNNGLISLQQFCAKEGIGTQAALTEGIVTFKNDDTHYTIAQAVAMMKPRRVVITLGTNDTGMEVSDFISNYTELVQAIQASYPYADIIVNTVPPIPADHSTYPNMEQTKIDDFNMALLEMCEQLGLHFLNSAEMLKDETGYGKAEYYTSGDIHLKNSGLKAVLTYLRTHAYQTEDTRPDTSNIPTRTLEYSSNPSSAVAAPSSSSESSQATVLYEARYQVEKSGGGTLSCGSDSGQTSLTYSITDASQSFSVTADPADGYVFVKWSDGVTSRTRTDKDFKQNVDVTAVFSAVLVQISCEGNGLFGTSYTFKASLKGKYASAENLRWYANGEEVTEAAGMTTVPVEVSLLHETSYKVYAVLTYNGCTVTSNTLTITARGTESSSSSSSSSSSGSASGSTSSSSAAPADGAASSGSTASSSSSGSSSSEASSASDSNGASSKAASSGSASSSGAAASSGASHSTGGEAEASTSQHTGSASGSGAAVSSAASGSSSHSGSASVDGSTGTASGASSASGTVSSTAVASSHSVSSSASTSASASQSMASSASSAVSSAVGSSQQASSASAAE